MDKALATPVKDEVAAIMPVLEKEPEAAPVVNQQVAPAPPSFNPVVSFIEQEEEDQPMVFELSIDAPAPKVEEKPVSPEEWRYEPKKMTDDHPIFNAGLNKPTQIYNGGASQSPAPKDAADQIKETISAIKNPQPVPVQQPLEESLRPVINEPVSQEEEETRGISLVYEEPTAQPQAGAQPTFFNNNDQSSAGRVDLSEEEEQKRRAQERINRLRNLSFNPMNVDNSGEFENVPAYMRRSMDMHNSAIANVEDFYSRARVKTDENDNTSISTLNTFLHGDRPD